MHGARPLLQRYTNYMKNILRAIGYGVVLWALMFAIVSALLPWYEMTWMKVLLVIVSGVGAYLLAMFAKIEDKNQALLYGSIWLMVALVLEALITARFNPNIFNETELWIGYFLTMCAPILYAQRKSPDFWKKAGTAFVIGALTAGLVAYMNARREATSDYKNATYIVEGKPVTLVRGMAETDAAPGSATKIVTLYFGNEVRKDLDGDGREDVAFLITQERGGSGTFFYLVGALNKPDGIHGTEAYLLGDRIAPQTTESGSDRSVVVNYAVRPPDAPFSQSPSIGVTKTLILGDTLAFHEFVLD